MYRTAHVTLEHRLRRLTGLAVVAAASIRARTQPSVATVAPVPQIVSNPSQVAADKLEQAYESLKQGDPSASDPELFRQLRLMMNRLENGGLSARSPRASITRQPATAAPSVPERRRDAWLGGLRSRLLGSYLR